MSKMSNFENWLDENNISIGDVISVTKAYCRKMGNSNSFVTMDVDDVSQEVLLKLFKFYHKYNKDRAKATTFIRSIQISKIKDCLTAERNNRSNKSRKFYTFDKDAKDYNTYYVSESMEMELAYEDDAIEMTHIFEDMRHIKFTERERVVIDYRLKGFPKNEIAVIMQVTPSRISEILNSIRKKITKQ